MLMPEDSQSVLNAFKLVLDESQKSIRHVEGLMNRNQKPEQSLENVCSVVQSHFSKIERIKNHCESLNNLPAPIDQTIKKEYDSERDTEYKQAFRKITNRQAE